MNHYNLLCFLGNYDTSKRDFVTILSAYIREHPQTDRQIYGLFTSVIIPIFVCLILMAHNYSKP